MQTLSMQFLNKLPWNQAWIMCLCNRPSLVHSCRYKNVAGILSVYSIYKCTRNVPKALLNDHFVAVARQASFVMIACTLKHFPLPRNRSLLEPSRSKNSLTIKCSMPMLSILQKHHWPSKKSNGQYCVHIARLPSRQPGIMVFPGNKWCKLHQSLVWCWNYNNFHDD